MEHDVKKRDDELRESCDMKALKMSMMKRKKVERNDCNDM